MHSKVKQARSKVEALRLALLSPSPEEVAAALPGLNEAALCLTGIDQELRQGSPAFYELRRELEMLRNELRISARLVDHGIVFWRGWAKLAGAGPSYTPSGYAAVTPSEAMLSLQG